MRNLITVIDQMIAIIPQSESELIADLLSIKESCKFTAPEIVSVRWRSAAETLTYFIPEHKDKMSDWQKKVFNIWMDIHE